MNDLLYKGHFKGLDIAFTYAVTTASVNEAVVRHDCDPAAAHILGRAMTGALLAAAILPEGQRINASWKYAGALKTIVVDAGQDGTVRSLVSPEHLSGFTDTNEGLYGEMGELQVIVTEGADILSSGTTPISLHAQAAPLPNPASAPARTRFCAAATPVAPILNTLITVAATPHLAMGAKEFQGPASTPTRKSARGRIQFLALVRTIRITCCAAPSRANPHSWNMLMTGT